MSHFEEFTARVGRMGVSYANLLPFDVIENLDTDWAQQFVSSRKEKMIHCVVTQFDKFYPDQPFGFSESFALIVCEAFDTRVSELRLIVRGRGHA